MPNKGRLIHCDECGRNRLHHIRGQGIVVVLCLMVVLMALAACTIQSDEEGLYTGKARLQAAQARATEMAVDIDGQVRRAEIDTEREAHRVAMEATKVAYTTAMSATLMTAPIEAKSRADVMRAIGNAGAIAVYIVAIGLVLALVICTGGCAIAKARSMMLASSYVQFGVEKTTFLPPPLIVTADGYLIDTRTGERARLRDAVGVNQLRLAATTHATEVARICAAQVEIARLTKSDKDSDALMGVAGNVPMLGVGEEDAM